MLTIIPVNSLFSHTEFEDLKVALILIIFRQEIAIFLDFRGHAAGRAVTYRKALFHFSPPLSGTALELSVVGEQFRVVWEAEVCMDVEMGCARRVRLTRS